MRTTAQMRALWAPAGASHNNAVYTFWNGVRVRGDARAMPALAALDRILFKYQYRPLEGQTWGYNFRAITGGSAPSLHAFGIAFDINSLTNPYGKRLVSNMDRRMVEEIEALVTIDGVRVWRWGGDWDGDNVQDDPSYDAMHFELQASPAELARGIRGTSAADISDTTTEEDEVTPQQFDTIMNVGFKFIHVKLDELAKAIQNLADVVKAQTPPSQ